MSNFFDFSKLSQSFFYDFLKKILKQAHPRRIGGIGGIGGGICAEVVEICCGFYAVHPVSKLVRDSCAKIEVAQIKKAEICQENKQAGGKQIPGKTAAMLFPLRRRGNQAQATDIDVNTQCHHNDGVDTPKHLPQQPKQKQNENNTDTGDGDNCLKTSTKSDCTQETAGKYD